MANIFQSIGNAFKTGFNNGNIVKGLKIAGAASFAAGASGALIHDMHNSSIFGSGCYYGSGFMGMMPSVYNNNPYALLNQGGMYDMSLIQQDYAGESFSKVKTLFGNMPVVRMDDGTLQCNTGNGLVSAATEDELILKIGEKLNSTKES